MMKGQANNLRGNSGKRVFVGMSGGVDSSVSAALLKKEGYAVTGVFIKVWQPDWMDCNWRLDRLDAMRVAAVLDIPFFSLDLEKEYKRDVVDYMIAEYKAGRTPNPDVMCNKSVKFGAFYDWAIKNGADFVATGHYARIAEKVAPDTATFLGLRNSLREIATVSAAGRNFRTPPTQAISARSNSPRPSESSASVALKCSHYLLAGSDPNKDQSYFLWNIRREQLPYILFPIGDIEKPDVRKLAKKFKLPNADKKDSQGLCFIGKVDIKEFLSHYMKPKEGEVLDESGKVIGHHDGAFFLTIGERHGFVVEAKTPNDQPYFIVSKDIEKNTITVSNKDSQGLLAQAKRSIKLEKTNWINGIPEVGPRYLGRARYRQPVTPLVFTLIKEKENTAEIEFDEPQNALTPGQSLVVYDEDVCLGGGVIL